MSQLKFKGSPDHRVPRPNSYFLGQHPQYLGLSIDENGAVKPVEILIDDATMDGQRLLKLARRDGAFVPVDEAAHAAIGREFTPAIPAKKAVTNG